MYTVYILQSTKNNRYYIGHTADLKKRLRRHNSGGVRSTKPGKPWNVVYQEKHKTKSEAYCRELEIKSYKHGILFKKLISMSQN